MKATTIRFSEDLWRTISTEAEVAGVSASQFIREAALARAASAAGARGELPFATLQETIDHVQGMPASSGDAEIQTALTALSRALARSFRSESTALRAQSEQARRNAESLVGRLWEADAARLERPDSLLD